MLNKPIIPEILAPAGDMERLEAAILFGADAVYLAGREFGMRTAASNFDEMQLVEAVKKAHAAGVRVYLTCNTVAHEDEIARLPQFLQQAEEAGVDALIISDIGVMRLAQKYAPRTAIHISTQAGIANSATARAFYEMGAQRVVLAREMSLEEIATLRANIPKELEVEAFVHGSMCVSFSGRCLLSSYLTSRDSNRGDCSQPCRWKYHLMEESRPGQYFPVFEDERGTHILNSRDMCMIEYIPQLVQAGITCFKIEGRAKSAYYTAVVTNAYRAARDAYLACADEGFVPERWIIDEMSKVSHREYSTGFYLGTEPGQVLDNGGYVRDYEVAAVVTDWAGGVLYATQRNKFYRGDELDVLVPRGKPFLLTASEIYTPTGELLDSTPHPMMPICIPCKTEVPKGTLLRRKK